MAFLGVPLFSTAAGHSLLVFKSAAFKKLSASVPNAFIL